MNRGVVILIALLCALPASASSLAASYDAMLDVVDVDLQVYDFINRFRDMQATRDGEYRDISRVRYQDQKAICSDTDGGQIYGIKGTVTGVDTFGRNFEKTDFCREIADRKKGGRESVLVEYSCSATGRLSYTTHPCRDCKEGTCPSLGFLDERRAMPTGMNVLNDEARTAAGQPTEFERFTQRFDQVEEHRTNPEGDWVPTAPIVRYQDGGLANSIQAENIILNRQRADPLKTYESKLIYPYYRYQTPVRARYIVPTYRYGISERALIITPRYVTYRDSPWRGQLLSTAEPTTN